jgi:hypothetical protein
MKDSSHNLYLTILDEWLSGEGIDFKKHNIQKDDIPLMVNFYQRYITKETSREIVLAIIYKLLEL